MKYIFLLTLALSAGTSCFAAVHIFSCTGNISATDPIRVNIIPDGDKIKATILEGTTRSTWDTYHVTEQSGRYTGTDSKGRPFVADIKLGTGRLIQAIATDLTQPKGVSSLDNIALICK